MGAVARIGEKHVRDGFDTGISEAGGCSIDHGDELLDVACLIGDVRCYDDLGGFVNDGLGVIGVMEETVRHLV